MKKVRFEGKSKLGGKFRDSSNFNKGNEHYEGIHNGMKQDYSCHSNASNQRLLKFQ